MKYFSAFAGIGGFELGIQQAYEEKNTDLEEKCRDLEEANLTKKDQDSAMAIIQRKGRWTIAAALTSGLLGIVAGAIALLK